MCTHVYASMHKHMQDTYTCMHMCTSAHMQAHECARLCMSACLQAHTRAQPLTGIPSSPADALPGKFQAMLALPMVLRARVQAGLREKLQAWLCSKVGRQLCPSLSPGASWGPEVTLGAGSSPACLWGPAPLSTHSCWSGLGRLSLALPRIPSEGTLLEDPVWPVPWVPARGFCLAGSVSSSLG